MFHCIFRFVRDLVIQILPFYWPNIAHNVALKLIIVDFFNKIITCNLDNIAWWADEHVSSKLKRYIMQSLMDKKPNQAQLTQVSLWHGTFFWCLQFIFLYLWFPKTTCVFLVGHQEAPIFSGIQVWESHFKPADHRQVGDSFWGEVEKEKVMKFDGKFILGT